MEDSPVSAVSLEGPVGELSLWALFLEADLVVKLVIVLLLLASVWCWAVIIDKAWRLRRLAGKAQGFERAFWSGTSLDDLYERLGRRPDNPLALMFAAGFEEWRDAATPGDAAGRDGLLARVERVMALARDRALDELERSLGSLATIGAAAPFVGLFGTVWGIMNSFQSIAVTRNTTLAVVAPGIAEALFATALGLVAAIPAVVAYNKLSGDIDRFANRMTGFIEEITVVLAREFEAGREDDEPRTPVGGSRAA